MDSDFSSILEASRCGADGLTFSMFDRRPIARDEGPVPAWACRAGLGDAYTWVVVSL